MRSADPSRRVRVPQVGHLTAVAVALILLAMWGGAPGQVSVDEGAAALQAQRLTDHSTWAFDYPLEVVDPTGSAFPLRSTTQTDDGYVPFAKHPLYPMVLSWADRVAGTAGMVGLSIAGAVLSAAAAAWLAERLRGGLAVPTTYVVGLGSPLLVDSRLLIAHTLGAAAVGGAAIALVRHHEARRTVTPWLAPAATGLALATLFRGEGLLLVGAVGAVAGVVALVTRSRAWWATAVTAALAGGLGLLVDRAWRAAILGDGLDLPAAPSSSGAWLGDRLDALGTTLVRPGYGGRSEEVLLLVGVALLATSALALRRRPPDERAAGLLAMAAGGCTAAWALSGPGSLVPGLLVAFPLLWFGLVVGAWWEDPLARALAAVSAAFAVAVFATQYRQGGGLEWGARYLALALPLVVPVALLGVAQGADRVTDPRTTRTVGAGLAVLTVALSVTGLRVARDLAHAAEAFGGELAEVAPRSRVGPDDQDLRPVVVSADFIIPQVLWPDYEDARWLRLRDDEPIAVEAPDPRVEALVAAGVDRFTFVTRDWRRDRPLLGGARELAHHRLAGFDVVVVEPAP